LTLICHNPKLPEPSNFTTSNLLTVDILSIDILTTRGLTDLLPPITPPDLPDLSILSPDKFPCSSLLLSEPARLPSEEPSRSLAREPHELLQKTPAPTHSVVDLLYFAISDVTPTGAFIFHAYSLCLP
jgi:hypothetical protein